jgi:hypothetical protein
MDAKAQWRVFQTVLTISKAIGIAASRLETVKAELEEEGVVMDNEALAEVFTVLYAGIGDINTVLPTLDVYAGTLAEDTGRKARP